MTNINMCKSNLQLCGKCITHSSTKTLKRTPSIAAEQGLDGNESLHLAVRAQDHREHAAEPLQHRRVQQLAVVAGIIVAGVMCE